jgi:hypothetical protein
MSEPLPRFLLLLLLPFPVFPVFLVLPSAYAEGAEHLLRGAAFGAEDRFAYLARVGYVYGSTTDFTDRHEDHSSGFGFFFFAGFFFFSLKAYTSAIKP